MKLIFCVFKFMLLSSVSKANISEHDKFRKIVRMVYSLSVGVDGDAGDDLLTAKSTAKIPLIDRTVLYPTADILAKPIGVNAEDSFNRYRDQIKNILPMELFKAGVCDTITQPLDFDYLLPTLSMDSGDPVTFIILPGFMQELMGDFFIEWQAGSSYKFEYEQALQRSGSSLKNDQRYSLAAQAVVDASLDEVVRIFSLDDKMGNPLVQIIYMKPLFGSMESFDAMSEVVPIYKRRLDKVFEILPMPKKLFLAGHSMGAMRVAALLSDIEKQIEQPEWYVNLAGVISLNGAIWGSALADAHKIEGTIIHSLVTAGEKILQMPMGSSETKKRAEVVYQAVVPLLDLFEMSAKRLKHAPKIKVDSATLVSIYALISKVLFEVGLDETKILQIVMAAVSPRVSTSPITTRVAIRMKDFIEKTLQAMAELTEVRRFTWFRDHTIPNHMPYYSLAASLPSPRGADKSNNAKNQLLSLGYYNPFSIDYLAMRLLSFDAFMIDSVQIIDGLVGVHQSQWHSGVMMQLNPRQKPLDEHFMGILATNHVNLLVSRILGGDDVPDHPYPRDVIFKAMRYYLNQDLGQITPL